MMETRSLNPIGIHSEKIKIISEVKEVGLEILVLKETKKEIKEHA